MSLLNKITLAALFLVSFAGGLQAQAFRVTCDTINYYNKIMPVIYHNENLFDDACAGGRIGMKYAGSVFTGHISIQRPVFITLHNTQLLAIPNQNVTGLLKQHGDIFAIDDPDNINRFFRDANDTIAGIVVQYGKNTKPDLFYQLFDSLQRYINNATVYVASAEARARFKTNIETIAAINQFFKMRLAHFSMLPILLNGRYTDSLFSLVKQTFKTVNGNYWLQTQPGRIFLRTYFTKVLLPQNNYDLQKALNSGSIYKEKDIRSYATYHYFRSWLQNDSTRNNLTLIEKEFAVYLTENRFNAKEKETLTDLLKQIRRSGNNIVSSFARQKLLNSKGITLNNPEKTALLQYKGNIIVDYWASWCAPCIAFIKTLQSDEIVYKGEKYKFIFISVDTDQKSWLSKHYAAIRPYNSFRLTDPKSPSFFTDFKISGIPRLFLIKDGIIINQNFEKEKL